MGLAVFILDFLASVPLRFFMLYFRAVARDRDDEGWREDWI